MVKLDEIVRQVESLDDAQHLKKLNIHKRKDVNELPNILRDDEKIEKFAEIFYSNRPGTVVATNQRFLIMKMTAFSGVKVEELSYDRINSVEYNQGLTGGGLQLFLKDRRIEIGGINNALVQGISDYIRSKTCSPESRETIVVERGDSMVSPTLDEIVGQIKRLDRTKHILKRKEVKELPGILHNNEKIEKIGGGEYNKSYGIILATDQRFLFISKSMLSGLKVKDYPYDKIDSVKLDKKIYPPFLPGGELSIYSQGNLAAVIEKIEEVLAPGIFDFILGKIGSPEINEIVKNIGGTKILQRGEIRELPGILRNDEKIEKISKGFYDQGDGIIVATDQRILFISKDKFSSIKVIEFPYEEMDSVQFKKGLIFCDLHIYSKDKLIKIVDVEKTLVSEICDFIQSKINSSK